MSGTGRDNDSSRPIDSLDSFEHLEGIVNSQSEEDFEPDLPFDIPPPGFHFDRDGFSNDDLENPGSIQEEPLTNESLGGDILHFDDERETSGLLNESELMNNGDQHYDSGSNCPSEDVFYKEGDPLRKGSSMDLLQRYMEATPRANNASHHQEPNYASDYGDNDRSVEYSDDLFHPNESFHNGHNEQYSDVLPPRASDQIRNHRRNRSNGFVEEERSAGEDSDEISAAPSTELNNTVVANGHFPGKPSAYEEKYEDDPPDGKDSDSASMSLGQFVPNAVNRNRLPRPMGKPSKRSTPKDERDLIRSSKPNDSRQGSVGNRSARSSARNSPRLSATGPLHTGRGRNSPRYSQRSDDHSDRSRNKQSSTNPNGFRNHARSPIVPRLELRRTSTASSANLSLYSEPSKLDLSLRLQEESKTRQQADELNEQLQKNYDELLGKFARAENTIDQLKLGARVNLYGDSPAPGQSIQGTLSPAQKPGAFVISHPQKATLHHISSSGNRMSGGQMGNQPPNQTGATSMGMQTNNNNKVGPAGTRPSEMARTSDSDGFPAGEGILMALAFQVRSQQEQIDSFGILLQENQLAPSEQKAVLAQLRTAQGKLEADYMQAKEEHNALRRRNSLLNGGAELTFDPDRSLEGEIFQLGMKLEDLAEIVQTNLNSDPPATLPLPHAYQDEELQRLRQKLERGLQKSRQDEERFSTGDNEQDAAGLQPGEGDSGNSLSPNQSEEEFPSPGDAPSLFSPPKHSRPTNTTKGTDRNPKSKVATDLANGQRRPKQSQHPRPTSLTNKTQNHDPRESSNPRQNGGNTKRNGVPQQKLPDRSVLSPEADSGFMGSESSRQSNQNGGLPGYDGHNQLRRPRDRLTLRSSKLPTGQRSPPQVSRKLMGNRESPGFSDYDISERDEEMDEASTRSAGAGKRRQAAVERTVPAKSTSQTRGRKKPAAVTRAPEKQREQRQDRERHGLQPDGRTGAKYLTNPNKTWDDYRDGPASYPEPTSNYRPSPKQSREPQSLQNGNPREGIDPIRSRDRSPFRVPMGRLRMPPQRGYDSESNVTRSSGKSEAIRDLQGEVERLKHQMAKLSSREKNPRRSPAEEETRHRTPNPKRSHYDGAGSEAGSGRSEILRALQNEIDDLRNAVNQQTASSPTNDAPMSRTSLRDPTRDEYPPRDEYRPRNDYQDTSYTGSPPSRDGLRETLTYIPKTDLPESLFTRTPMRPFLHSSTPYRSHTHNPMPQSSPSYIPEAAPIPASPPRTHTQFQPSRARAPPSQGVTSSPLYTIRQEPCPLCSGSGVQTHGEYSHHHSHHTAVIADSAPHQASAASRPTQYPNPSPSYAPTGVSVPQNQSLHSNPGQQSTLYPQQLVSNQQTVQHPKPVFNPQPVANPVLTQSQPVTFQPQPVLNQPQPVLNQPQPVLNQPQPSLNQSQPVLTQSQPILIPATQTPVNQGPNQTTSMQTSVPQVVLTQPATYVPLVTLPVYAGVPVNATQQGTSEKQSRSKSRRKTKTDSQKSTSKPQAVDQSTTIYITPTKRRGRYYVLDDEEIDPSGMEEEMYFRRTPRGSSSKGSSFLRRTKDTKYAHSSSLDLDEAIKMADKLNRSSHRMLETVRSDLSQSQFL